MLKEQDVKKRIKLVSENILQVDTIYELWEEKEYSVKDIESYDYILECDSNSLYKIVR
jgi:hypothetical protein